MTREISQHRRFIGTLGIDGECGGNMGLPTTDFMQAPIAVQK